ncbi:CcdB protein [Solimicrobium silvestre]|uniref:Toxin CcdB n=1 Tax=Solimicrobium silvestre TaxID=2099400 RepID=A0A2S9GSM8_9BURK|nr:CcdB protein [Solimicrobium silvestre]
MHNNIVSGLISRVVIPLRPLQQFQALNIPIDVFPLISVNGNDYFLDTPQLGAIDSGELKNIVSSAQIYQFEIQNAIDRVLGGY